MTEFSSQHQGTLPGDFATNQPLELALEVFDDGQHTDLADSENYAAREERRRLERLGQQALAISADALVTDLDRLIAWLEQEVESQPSPERHRTYSVIGMLGGIRHNLLNNNRYAAKMHANTLFQHFENLAHPNRDYALNIMEAIKTLGERP